MPPFPVPGKAPSSVLEVDLAGGPGASSLSVVVSLPGVLREGPGISAKISLHAGAWVVDEGQIPIEVGDRCALVAPSQARCPVPGSPDAVLLDGSGGDDWLEVDPSVPATASAFIAGDVGSDLVIGGAGDDNLTGAPGDGSPHNDVILGGGGEDSLTSGVQLRGGPGSDLLISSVCAGEEVDGGAGVDSVSFARVTSAVGVEATIGGTARLRPVHNQARPGSGWLRLRRPRPCSDGHRHLGGEDRGQPGDDVLHGDGAGNVLLGRAGEDHRVYGEGGDDFLVGGTGRDSIYGGAGADRL